MLLVSLGFIAVCQVDSKYDKDSTFTTTQSATLDFEIVMIQHFHFNWCRVYLTI